MDDKGFIAAHVAAKLIMVTERHLSRLVKDGWIKKSADGKYTLIGVVQGYILSLRDEKSRNSQKSAQSKTQDARSREIEQRMAMKDRRLVAMEEVFAVNDEAWGKARDLIVGFPAKFTRDLELRRKLDNEMDIICNGIATRLKQARTTLVTDSSYLGEAGEDDAGPVGPGEPNLSTH